MRRRLVGTSLVLVLAALSAFALPLGFAVRAVLEARALDALQGGTEQLGLVLEVTARDCAELRLRIAQVADSSPTFTVVASGGIVLATTAEEVPSLGEELEQAAVGRIGRSTADGRVAVAVPLATDVCGRPLLLHASQPDTELRRGVVGAWTLIAGVALGVATVAAISVWWLGRRLAAPFEALTTSARRLGEGDFSVRAPRSDLPEADAIAVALDDTAARLGRAMERSAAFTADASHQLRTPLTALRLQLESLEAQGADAAGIAAAFAEADRLEATIDDLVSLTRVEAPEVEVDLGALIAERLPAWGALGREQGREVRLERRPTPAVRVRPGAVIQAVAVLVDNALRHAEGDVVVRVAPTAPDRPGAAVQICVIDAGPGPDAVALRPGGRGLVLARTLVAAEGGQVTVGAASGGSRICVVIPVRRP